MGKNQRSLLFHPLAALLATTALITGGYGVARAEPGSISGGTEDWLEAVCEPGTFNDGQSWMRSAIGGATCRSQVSTSDIILFTQWDSNFKMRNAMTQFRQCYTSVLYENGNVEVLSVMPNAPAGDILNPLSQFGFANFDCAS